MFAVITGDVVHSTKLSSHGLQSAQQSIAEVIRFCNENWQVDGELYRGDGFQLLVPQPGYAFRCAVLLATHLAKDDIGLTLSIGLGQVKQGQRVGLSQGEAFELSGRGLDASSRGELSFHSADNGLQQCFALPAEFLSFLLHKLTSRQAEVLYAWVESDFAEHKYIAEKLAMTRQNVNLHLSKAGGNLVQKLDQQFLSALANYSAMTK